MPRDLDFRSKYVSRPTSKPMFETPQPVPASRPVQKKRGGSLWLITIVTILASAAVLYWQLGRPQAVVNTQKTETTSLPTLETGTSANGSILSPTKTGPSIQIYDSGAGKEAVNAAINKLKTIGYTAEDLDQSQFTYDKTFIWYRAGMLTEAEKIKTLLADPSITLTETKITGLFDVLILLGK